MIPLLLSSSTPKWTLAAPLIKPLLPHKSQKFIISKDQLKFYEPNNVSCQAIKSDIKLQNPNSSRRKALIALGLGGLYGVVLSPSSADQLICPPTDELLPGDCMHTMELSLTSMIAFPRLLESVIGVDVARKLKSRMKKKQPKEEVLVVVVELLPTDAPIVKFDVYVNEHRPDQNRSRLIKAHYVGSFSSSPWVYDDESSPRTMETSLKLGLDRYIDALGAWDDEKLEVSLVPRSGQYGIVIHDVRIEYNYDN